MLCKCVRVLGVRTDSWTDRQRGANWRRDATHACIVVVVPETREDGHSADGGGYALHRDDQYRCRYKSVRRTTIDAGYEFTHIDWFITSASGKSSDIQRDLETAKNHTTAGCIRFLDYHVHCPMSDLLGLVQPREKRESGRLQWNLSSCLILTYFMYKQHLVLSVKNHNFMSYITY